MLHTHSQRLIKCMPGLHSATLCLLYVFGKRLAAVWANHGTATSASRSRQLQRMLQSGCDQRLAGELRKRVRLIGRQRAQHLPHTRIAGVAAQALQRERYLFTHSLRHILLRQHAAQCLRMRGQQSGVLAPLYLRRGLRQPLALSRV